MTRGNKLKIALKKRSDLIHREQKRRALKAVAEFRPHKRERGKVIMIGISGGHTPQKHGKKGYAAYVTTTGKVRLLRAGYKNQPYKARKLRDIELPIKANLHKRVRAFRTAQIGRGRAVKEAGAIKKAVAKSARLGLAGDTAYEYQTFQLSGRGKGRGQVKTGGAWDFNQSAVRQIASHVRKVIKAQRGQRTFTIEVIALIKLPDGSKEVVNFTIGIARNDSDAIEIGGVEAFVRQKFYAFMARELSFRGYVTTGSANHIRRLPDNRGVDRGEWTDKRGNEWVGRDLEVVNLLQLEWKITQAI